MAQRRSVPWRRTFLREWREYRGLSLEAAAAQMGMKHSAISRMERGLTPYNQRVLEAAAKVYGCTVQDLITRPPDAPGNIFETWERLDARQRRRAVHVLNALREADQAPYEVDE